jgi:tRNA nucleotidyltransferase (CCA-adding enzyme)
MLRQKHLDLCQLIVDAGGTPFVVGGFVRDMLLGRQPKDVDVMVVGASNELCRLLHKHGELVGDSFPVWKIVTDHGDVEVALARTEQKTDDGQGYKGFDCQTEDVTLEQDLQRRDLTINAMAMDPFTGKVFDPFRGARDLADGVLRPVGAHFGEDPLRVLRAARFAAQLGMVLSDELVEVAQVVLPELITLPGERLWGELEKALRTPKPSLFFEALDKLGALEVVLPEIDALQGRTQPEKYHPEGDAYVHTLEVVDRAAELGADDETMFAALTHDLGKAVTDDDNLPHHYNHEALGVPLVHDMCDRLRVPNTHRKVAAVTAKDHLNVHRFDDLKPVKKVRLLMRLLAVQGDQMLSRVVLASKADARGRGPLHANDPYEQGDRLLKAAGVIRQVRGHEFAHLKDGQKIAQNMERARAKALKGAGF